MVQRHAHINRRANHRPRCFTDPPRHRFRTDRIRTNQPRRAMLLGRTNGKNYALGGLQVGFDFGPSGEVELHRV